MAITSLFFAARRRAFALGVLLLMLFTVGCSDQNTQPTPVPTASVWTFNEGQYGLSNSDIIPYDPINKIASPSDLFSSANGGAVLGDVPTSVIEYNGQLFVSLSGSGKVYVLDQQTGVLKAKITGLDSPRYIYIVSETKGYISNVNKPEITIFNPTTLTVTGTIALESAAEQFVVTPQGLFVNLWSYGKKIAKIDPATDKVTASIEVGIQPASITVDQDGNLWAVCDGSYPGSPIGNENPSLSKLNATATAVLHKWELPQLGGFSYRVAAHGDYVYVLSTNVYRVALNATEFPTTPFIAMPTGVKGYSMGIDPENGDIYVGDAVDYTQRGMVYRYNKEGQLVDQYKAGVCPAFYYFQPTK